jgi:16S rRNA (guanine527-N7)-methyltransferase
MAVVLPLLTFPQFAEELEKLSPERLPPGVHESLFRHYEELRRWSERLSLVGPGTAAEVLDRHYGESLAALPYLSPDPAGRLIDVGSGAGFPGLVVAAARPSWQVTLIEAQERKWAFLQAAARCAGLSCRCLNARVATLLPPGLPDAYEAVTVRALSLSPELLAVLAERLTPSGRLLLWAGSQEPKLPPGLRVASAAPLAGSRVRRLLVVEQQ